ncbi:MAG: hypothetical protein WA948_12655 [Pontixanthobacter sp.]
MANNTHNLKNSLRDAGLGDPSIDAAWPDWWSDDLAGDASGEAELRFALSKRLGLAPRSLLGEEVEFIWNDEARFKHLTAAQESHRAALTSFGISFGRILLKATPNGPGLSGLPAEALRRAITAQGRLVDLQALLPLCWGMGVPVVHLRVFPLPTKSMHAMIVAHEGRHAILLGRDANYPAPIAFTLAHEMGHAALGHLDDGPAIVDMEDPGQTAGADEHDGEEQEADRFALSLLTGSPEPLIEVDRTRFNSPTLAGAALKAAQQYGIEPGVLALCLGYQRNVWPTAMTALKFIYRDKSPVWEYVNNVAMDQIDFSQVSNDAAVWIRTVLDRHG